MIQHLQGNRAVLLGAVAILSIGLTTSGYLLGDGLRRAKAAERSVTVRGVSERDVTADLATWTISFSDEGTSLAPVQASVDDKGRAVRAFFAKAGFAPADVSDTAINATQSYDRDRKEDRVNVSRSIQLRNRDVMKVRAAYARQSELIRDGVPMSGSNVNYVFTGLNALKPDMIAEANRNARRSAEQFAHDSGAAVGAIKTASQGYFSVGPRDGELCEECGSSGGASPFQKVRVVTTIDYDLG
ncbi:MAG: SIMPL domain-containing protein [Sphingomicrobium sp.]